MKTILTSGADHRARFGTSRPASPSERRWCIRARGCPFWWTRQCTSRRHDGPTVSNDATDLTRVAAQSTTRLWHLPSLLDDDLPRITVWVETITGLAVSDEGRIYGLDAAAWRERRERLRTLGGPPKADSGWLFDPALYGTDPTGRARAWIERSSGPKPRPRSPKPFAPAFVQVGRIGVDAITLCGRSRRRLPPISARL